MVLLKHQLEIQLKDEHQLIKEGIIRDDAPLDTSEEFEALCNAARRGDLRACQECIARGVNVNARDRYDYTPLILASLCGHYETVKLLLESGALCERDTFSGERCLYNALNDRIRSLLLKYDYSKSTDPLQPFAAHISSLLSKTNPQTSDIELTSSDEIFKAHKLVLAARSPYFAAKLANHPETKHWKLAHSVPPESFQLALKYLYLGEVPKDLGLGPSSKFREEEVLLGIDKLSKHLEIESLWNGLLAGDDRRILRQQHQDEVARGRDQIDQWFRNNVLKHKIILNTHRVPDVKWDHDNSIFADVLLQADAQTEEEEAQLLDSNRRREMSQFDGIPVGPRDSHSDPASETPTPKGKSVLYPAHKALLIRSPYFQAMFTSAFKEAQITHHLPIIYVDCSPAVLEAVLTFLYTEKTDFGLDIALDVLVTADMLLIEKLKNKAGVIISALGSGKRDALNDPTRTGPTGSKFAAETETEEEEIDVFEVLRTGWELNVQRLEEFAARYLASRLEHYIDDPEFEAIIKESAERVKDRQETDTIELLDDIRYYLSERFRMRLQDLGLNDMREHIVAELRQKQAEEKAEKQARRARREMEARADGAAPAREDTQSLINGINSGGKSSEAANGERANGASKEEKKEAKEVNGPTAEPEGNIQTLGDELADDEFSSDAINYQLLIDKLDALLEKLGLNA